MNKEKIRLYKESIHFWIRDERIKTVEVPLRDENNVVMETREAVQFPSYMGNRINYLA